MSTILDGRWTVPPVDDASIIVKDGVPVQFWMPGIVSGKPSTQQEQQIILLLQLCGTYQGPAEPLEKTGLADGYFTDSTGWIRVKDGKIVEHLTNGSRRNVDPAIGDELAVILEALVINGHAKYAGPSLPPSGPAPSSDPAPANSTTPASKYAVVKNFIYNGPVSEGPRSLGVLRDGYYTDSWWIPWWIRVENGEIVEVNTNGVSAGVDDNIRRVMTTVLKHLVVKRDPSICFWGNPHPVEVPAETLDSIRQQPDEVLEQANQQDEAKQQAEQCNPSAAQQVC